MLSQLGVGTDIEMVSRFSEIRAKDDRFLNSFMTNKEIEYCFSKESPIPHIAARFAAKEAVIKALGSLSIRGVSYKDIEIANDMHGTPSATIRPETKLNIDVKISLSHSAENAIAVAVAVKEELE